MSVPLHVGVVPEPQTTIDWVWNVPIVVTEAATMSVPAAESEYVNEALPAEFVRVLPVRPALGPDVTANATATLARP